KRVRVLAARHPLRVAPLVVESPDAGSRPRRRLGEERERIGLVDAIAVVTRADVILVRGPRLDARHETLPDTRPVAAGDERIGVLAPAVEVADDRDVLGVRRPDRQAHAPRAVDDRRMGAEHAVEPRVRPLAEVVDVAFVDRAVSVRRAPRAAGRIYCQCRLRSVTVAPSKFRAWPAALPREPASLDWPRRTRSLADHAYPSSGGVQSRAAACKRSPDRPSLGRTTRDRPEWRGGLLRPRAPGLSVEPIRVEEHLATATRRCNAPLACR